MISNPVFLYQSPLEIMNNEIKDFALEYRASSVETTVKKLCEAVNHKIAYKSGTTDVLTDSATVFRQQSGVCQDIAHVFIAALRTLKIPARYVAGYVSGLQLSHAWTEVYSFFDEHRQAFLADGQYRHQPNVSGLRLGRNHAADCLGVV